MIGFKPKSNPTIRIKSQRFFDNPMAILTPKNSINTPKIKQFHYKLIHPYPSSIRLPNYFFFVFYLNILKILVFKVLIIKTTRLIKVYFFVNLFCIYANFIFNVY